MKQPLLPNVDQVTQEALDAEHAWRLRMLTLYPQYRDRLARQWALSLLPPAIDTAKVPDATRAEDA